MHAIHGRPGTRLMVCEREEGACQVVMSNVCRVLEILEGRGLPPMICSPALRQPAAIWPLKRPGLDCGLR
jgi:hypothetical protein